MRSQINSSNRRNKGSRLAAPGAWVCPQGATDDIGTFFTPGLRCHHSALKSNENSLRIYLVSAMLGLLPPEILNLTPPPSTMQFS